MIVKKPTRAAFYVFSVLVIAYFFGVNAFLYHYTSSQVTQAAAVEREAFLEVATSADKQVTAAQYEKLAKEADMLRQADEKKAEDAKRTAEAVRTSTVEQASNLDSTTCNRSTTHNDPTKIDVIVNKKHCIQPLTFAPTDMITLRGATMKKEAAEAFERMMIAAENDGQPMTATSSYRSYQTQVSTYYHWVSVSGMAEADTYSARPGYSEHQTGLAVDVAAGGCALSCFGTTSQYQWMKNNAANYGFIQRYHQGYESTTGYSSEEWHYRYVGVDVAKDMKAKGIMTLEEYWGLPGGDY